MGTARAFGDPDLTPDNFNDFSAQEISADSKATGLTILEPFPAPRSTAPMDLANVIGSAAANKIQQSGNITFHTVGDTGGIQKPEFQFAVADAMARDAAASFWYHLGDVVYYFGQEQYYFEQFYDPYRDYNAPIFAIPGNHDGAVYKGETAKSLAAFSANFCTAAPQHSPDSQGAVRTTMDQPGVYFTLNAPFVKFIGLYSNTGEGSTEGVISGGKVGNAQLAFLQQQLSAAKAERANGQGRALVIATHHPPFTGSPEHVPSPTMLQQIDSACKAAGIQPDLYLSGHAHLYERYTRTVGGKQIPFLVAGMGGYYNLPGLKPNAVAPPKTPASGTDQSNNPLTLEVYNDTTFGFLRITVSPSAITGTFVTVDPSTGKTGVGDTFSVDLNAGRVSNSHAASKVPTKTASSKSSSSRTKKKVTSHRASAAAKTSAKKASSSRKAAKKSPASKRARKS
ncbi:MAG TPA: metallophosphoesterase [Terracidiphilus sp.]|nr:metallophosphoesterase [Terracidiphilus sp.]